MESVVRTEQGIGEILHEVQEGLAALQGAHRLAHRAHAVHKDGETHHDPAEFFDGRFLYEHCQNDPDGRDDPGQDLGRENASRA